MQIGPVSGGSHHYPPHKDSLQAKYDKLLNSFRDKPSKQTADNLLRFLNNPANKSALEKIALKNPNQHQIPTFEVSYQSAISALNGWEQRGCPSNLAVIPEEFLKDVHAWINY
jgi:hypothetical protein